MAKYCSNCGAAVTEKIKFCGNCGANMEEKPAPVVEPIQPQGYTPIVKPSRKSNAKIIALVAIIVVAVVIAVSFLVLFKGGDASKFVGTWLGGPGSIQFYSNGNLTMNFGDESTQGTYEIKDGKLVINLLGQGPIICDYSFSSNDRTLTISPITPPGDPISFIKQ